MGGLPIRRAQVDTQGFLAWLAQHGAEICTPTNEYEVVRYRAYWKKPRAETHILYAKESGLLTFTGATRVHYERFLAGEPMVGAGEQFVSKFDHTEPRHDPTPPPANSASARRRQKLLNRDGADCWFCGRALGGDETLEHLVPQSRGGGNDLANLVLAHAKCNQTAANLSISEKVELRAKMRTAVSL